MISKNITSTEDKICIELTLNAQENERQNQTIMNTQNTYIAVSTATLMELLNCGKKTAIEIGSKACAKVCVGRKILWNVRLIQEYLNVVAV